MKRRAKIHKAILVICGAVFVASSLLLANSINNKYQAYKITQRKAKIEAVLNALKSNTVLLAVCQGRSCISGTGFVVKNDSSGSWVVTNKHVCLPTYTPEASVVSSGIYNFVPIVIVTHSDMRSGGQVIRLAENTDLCLIRSDIKFDSEVKLAKTLEQNEEIFTFGFPSGKPEMNRGKFQEIIGDFFGFYAKTDMKIWYGASGSAIVNSQGEVVGVAAAISFKNRKASKNRNDVEYSLFIPLEILREFIGGI